MDEGWIKLPRNLLDTAVFLDERLLKLLIWCKFRANYVPQQFCGETIAEGEFVTSMERAAEALSCSKSAVWRGLVKLASSDIGLIRLRLLTNAKRRFTVVTVVDQTTSNSLGREPRNGSETLAEQERNETEMGAEQIEEREERKEGRKKNSPVDSEADAIAEAWNQLPDVPRVIRLTDGRRRAIRARLSDPHFRENWRAGLAVIGRSEFCRGLVTPANGRTSPWKASLEWLLKPDTLVKLLEGRYGGLSDQPDSKSAVSPRSELVSDCGNFRQPLPKLSLAEATTPAGFDRWFDGQWTFDKTDRYRQSLHAVRCSVARLFRQAEVARDQLQARLSTLADGRPLLDPPRAEDEQQARREIDQLGCPQPASNFPGDEPVHRESPIGGAA